VFRVLAGTGVNADSPGDGLAANNDTSTKQAERKALESIRNTALDGSIELRLYCVDRAEAIAPTEQMDEHGAGASTAAGSS